MSSKDMDTYNRRGQKPVSSVEPQQEEQIRVDGFGQVIQMLQVADAQFRESLLRRLAARDPELARNLRTYLANS